MILKFLSLNIALSCIIMSVTTSVVSTDYCSKLDYLECPVQYSYPCNEDYCVKNEKACKILSDLLLVLKSIRLIQTTEKLIQKFRSLIHNIKPCNFKKIAWKSEDVCINDMNCYFNQTLNFRMGLDVKILKKTDCVCQGAFNYTCDKNFCAMNRNGCSGLKLRRINISNSHNQISPILRCTNKNKFYQSNKTNRFSIQQM